METEAQKLLSIMETKKFSYEFLHLLFSQPLSIQYFQTWKEQLQTEQLLFHEYLEPFYKELKAQEVSQIYEREKESFLHLFFGPEHIPAPPWESVYRTKERLLFGEPTLQLRKKLKENNLFFERENKEPEDHIAIELEFMIYLIKQTLEAIETNDESRLSKSLHEQFLLLDEHLIQWVKPFTNDIKVTTSSSLYKGAAAMLHDLITQDHEYMMDMKEVANHEREYIKENHG